MMDSQGREVLPRFSVENNLPGSQAFIQRVAQQVVADDFDAIRIAAEATGWYWWHFFQTLDRDPFLNQWPLELYPLNPRLTANFRKTYLDLDHQDLSDASVIADRLRLGRDLPPPFHYYFCEGANQVRVCDPEYAAYYDRKYREVRQHQHKRALVLTGRKLVQLLTTHQPYQPRRHRTTNR